MRRASATKERWLHNGDGASDDTDDTHGIRYLCFCCCCCCCFARYSMAGDTRLDLSCLRGSPNSFQRQMKLVCALITRVHWRAEHACIHESCYLVNHRPFSNKHFSPIFRISSIFTPLYQILIYQRMKAWSVLILLILCRCPSHFIQCSFSNVYLFSWILSDLSRTQRTLSKSLAEFNFECIGSTQTDDEQVIVDSLKQFSKLIANIEDERDNMVSVLGPFHTLRCDINRKK